MENNKITRKDLVNSVSDTFGYSKAQSAKIVNHIIGQMQDAIVRGDSVTITGFGTLGRTERSEKVITATGFGKNKKAKKITVPARYAAKFEAGAKLKAALAGQYAADKK